MTEFNGIRCILFVIVRLLCVYSIKMYQKWFWGAYARTHCSMVHCAMLDICVGLDVCPCIFNDSHKWNVKYIQLVCFYFRSLKIRLLFMNGLFFNDQKGKCCNRKQLVSSCDLNRKKNILLRFIQLSEISIEYIICLPIFLVETAKNGTKPSQQYCYFFSLAEMSVECKKIWSAQPTHTIFSIFEKRNTHVYNVMYACVPVVVVAVAVLIL